MSKMSKRKVSFTIGAASCLGLLGFIGFPACGSTATPSPNLDAGGGGSCPPGPNSATAPSTSLPTGACPANEGPCGYEATPCPQVKNGAIFGYSCRCGDDGKWSCAIVNMHGGLCAPFPDSGPVDGSLPIGPLSDSGGATGPAQP